jgi:hypothetical protein
VIDEEMNRLFRSDAYNMKSCQKQQSTALSILHEKSILHGVQVVEDKTKLLAHSPAYSELTKQQDYLMLGIGSVDFRT